MDEKKRQYYKALNDNKFTKDYYQKNYIESLSKISDMTSAIVELEYYLDRERIAYKKLVQQE